VVRIRIGQVRSPRCPRSAGGAILVVVVVVLSACAGSAGGAAPADGGRLTVVTTVAPITSLAAAVIGDRADIEGIVPEGTNSHTFEPPPSAAELLAAADVIFMNGLQLEEPTKELAESNKAQDAELVELGALTIDEDEWVYDVSFPEDEGRPNPHLWTNPAMALRYAEVIRDTMSELDPEGTETYGQNYEVLAEAVGELDAAMRTSFATIAEGDRKLLTYHDAYAYFARDYGWDVIGAIQVSDFGDPTPKEVADLIEQIRAAGVPAIFGSEVFPSPVLEQIGREARVRHVDVLRDDDLPGEPGDPEHSLLGLLRFDYVTITVALGGDGSALDALDVTIATPDEASYPQ
jgi:ABC-type Zn uptake system ZnuABC Zn-binding protein ZnuA